MFALGYVAFIRRRWVYSGSPWGSSGLLVFTRDRRWVLPRSFGLLECAQGVVGFTGVRPRCSSGSLGCAMGVVGFSQCRWIHPETQVSLGLLLWVVGFIRCLLGSLGGALGVVEFIRGNWNSPCDLFGSAVVVGFTRVRVVEFTLVLPGTGWP